MADIDVKLSQLEAKLNSIGSSSEDTDVKVERLGATLKELNAINNSLIKGFESLSTSKFSKQIGDVTDRIQKLKNASKFTSMTSDNFITQHMMSQLNNEPSGLKNYGSVFYSIKQQYDAYRNLQNKVKQLKASESSKTDKAKELRDSVVSKYNNQIEKPANDELIKGIKMSASQRVEYFNKVISDMNKSQVLKANPSDFNKLQIKAYQELRAAEADLARETEQQNNKVMQSWNNVGNSVKRVCSAISNSLASFISIIRQFNNAILTGATKVISLFNSLGSAIKRIMSIFGSLSNRVGSINKNNRLMIGSFTELRSAIYLVTNAFNKLANNAFINEGRRLLSSIESLNTLIGRDLTDETIEWAKALEGALGVDAKGLISDMREVAGVLKGLGMSAEHTSVASRNLVSVAQTMSSVIGLDTQTVMNKIYSGMRGMTTAIDDIGLSVREAEMDSFLKSLKAQGGAFANISTSFASLNEEQRVYVRYASLMNQFMKVYSADNFIKSLDTVTGRLNILNQRCRSLKSTIGVVFLNLFDQLVLPLTYWIDQLNNKIKILSTRLFNLLGFDASKLDFTNEMNQSKVTADDLGGSIEGIGEAAQNAAKKVTGSLDSFDHVSNLSSNSSSDAFDYSSLMSESIDFAELLRKQALETDEYTKRLNEAWDEFRAHMSKQFPALTQMFETLGRIITNLKNTISGVFSGLANDLGVDNILQKVKNIINAFLLLVDTITNKLGSRLVAFFTNNKHVSKFADVISYLLDKLLYKLEEWNSWWSNDSNVDKFCESVKNKIKKLVDFIHKAIVIIKNLFGFSSGSDFEFVFGSDDKTFKLMYILAGSIRDVFASILEIVKGIAKVVLDINKDGILDSADVNLAISNIVKFVDKVTDFLNKNKDDIIKLVSALVDAVSNIAKAEFTGLFKILNWITSNSGVVIALLKAVESVASLLLSNPGLLIGLGALSKVGSLAGSAMIGAASFKTLTGLTPLAAASNVGRGAVGVASKVGTSAASLVASIKSGVVGALSGTGGLLGVVKTMAAGIGKIAVIVVLILGLIETIKGLFGLFKDGIDNVTGAYGFFTNSDGSRTPVDTRYISDRAYAIKKTMEDVFGRENITDDIVNKAIEDQVNVLASQLDLSTKQMENVRDRLAKEIDKLGNVGVFDDLFHNSVSYEELDKYKEYMIGLKNSVQTTRTDISREYSALAGSVTSSLRGMDLVVARSSSNVQNNCVRVVSSVSAAKKAINALGQTSANIGLVGATLALKAATLRPTKVMGYKNGGVPQKGSLFFANEGGSPELIGNFGGYSGVAPQNQILDAMKQAIGSSMYDAVSLALQNNSLNTSQTIEVCKGGAFIGSEAAIRQLANKINSINRNASTNIANVGFVL